MLSLLKTFKLALCCSLGFFLISSFSQAQESASYYRYFEVKLEQSVDMEKDIRSELFSQTPFQLRTSCNSRNSVLVAVRADYPKRVYQIEDELKTVIQSRISSDNIQSIHTVSALDLESFCQ